ncbi:hypothetical protein C1H46_022883 [Malus baccata]|uniref:Uncharacterized protein n=1 Tax=Malus baccata TaxID=106549 RepID=A0A540LYR1_MALBA|nr:hypothetical protein C1H46_022883 [Malus baccata]
MLQEVGFPLYFSLSLYHPHARARTHAQTHLAFFSDSLFGVPQVGFNGGVPITEEFFSEKITGGHNEYICGILFPDWDIERARQFFQDKESMYRR